MHFNTLFPILFATISFAVPIAQMEMVSALMPMAQMAGATPQTPSSSNQSGGTHTTTETNTKTQNNNYNFNLKIRSIGTYTIEKRQINCPPNSPQTVSGGTVTCTTTNTVTIAPVVNINAGRRSPVDLESEISHLLKLRSIDNQTAALIRRVTNDCSAELPTTNRSGGTRTCTTTNTFQENSSITINGVKTI